MSNRVAEKQTIVILMVAGRPRRSGADTTGAGGGGIAHELHVVEDGERRWIISFFSRSLCRPDDCPVAGISILLDLTCRKVKTASKC